MSDSEFAYDRRDFEKVRQALFAKTGIRLADSKDAMVYSRLARRLRALKIQRFSDYLAYMDDHVLEQQAFIDALTTNLTSFFREAHHFETLKNAIRTKPSARIWCAASSTGEEPYSIAMTVVETLGSFANKVEIIASDIDTQALTKARAGIYPIQAVEKLSPHQQKAFLFRGKGRHQGKVKVVPELTRMVQFKQINLTASDWPLKGNFDVIFCRNVMIYFDKATQIQILSRMVKLLNPDGLYIAGHSENFNSVPQLVTLVGKTVYRPVKGQALVS